MHIIYNDIYIYIYMAASHLLSYLGRYPLGAPAWPTYCCLWRLRSPNRSFSSWHERHPSGTEIGLGSQKIKSNTKSHFLISKQNPICQDQQNRPSPSAAEAFSLPGPGLPASKCCQLAQFTPWAAQPSATHAQRIGSANQHPSHSASSFRPHYRDPG